MIKLRKSKDNEDPIKRNIDAVNEAHVDWGNALNKFKEDHNKLVYEYKNSGTQNKDIDTDYQNKIKASARNYESHLKKFESLPKLSNPTISHLISAHNDWNRKSKELTDNLNKQEGKLRLYNDSEIAAIIKNKIKEINDNISIHDGKKALLHKLPINHEFNISRENTGDFDSITLHKPNFEKLEIPEPSIATDKPRRAVSVSSIRAQNAAQSGAASLATVSANKKPVPLSKEVEAAKEKFNSLKKDYEALKYRLDRGVSTISGPKGTVTTKMHPDDRIDLQNQLLENVLEQHYLFHKHLRDVPAKEIGQPSAGVSKPQEKEILGRIFAEKQQNKTPTEQANTTAPTRSQVTDAFGKTKFQSEAHKSAALKIMQSLGSDHDSKINLLNQYGGAQKEDKAQVLLNSLASALKLDKKEKKQLNNSMGSLDPDSALRLALDYSEAKDPEERRGVLYNHHKKDISFNNTAENRTFNGALSDMVDNEEDHDHILNFINRFKNATPEIRQSLLENRKLTKGTQLMYKSITFKDRKHFEEELVKSLKNDIIELKKTISSLKKEDSGDAKAEWNKKYHELNSRVQDLTQKHSPGQAKSQELKDATKERDAHAATVSQFAQKIPAGLYSRPKFSRDRYKDEDENLSYPDPLDLWHWDSNRYNREIPDRYGNEPISMPSGEKKLVDRRTGEVSHVQNDLVHLLNRKNRLMYKSITFKDRKHFEEELVKSLKNDIIELKKTISSLKKEDSGDAKAEWNKKYHELNSRVNNLSLLAHEARHDPSHPSHAKLENAIAKLDAHTQDGSQFAQEAAWSKKYKELNDKVGQYSRESEASRRDPSHSSHANLKNAIAERSAHMLAGSQFAQKIPQGQTGNLSPETRNKMADIDKKVGTVPRSEMGFSGRKTSDDDYRYEDSRASATEDYGYSDNQPVIPPTSNDDLQMLNVGDSDSGIPAGGLSQEELDNSVDDRVTNPEGEDVPPTYNPQNEKITPIMLSGEEDDIPVSGSYPSAARLKNKNKSNRPQKLNPLDYLHLLPLNRTTGKSDLDTWAELPQDQKDEFSSWLNDGYIGHIRR